MGIEPYMLEIQYRHLSIYLLLKVSWCAYQPACIQDAPHHIAVSHFYSGKIKDGIVAADRPSPTGLSWPSRGNPLAFVNVDSYESKRCSLFLLDE